MTDSRRRRTHRPGGLLSFGAAGLPTLLFAVLLVLALRAPRTPDLIVYGGTPQGVTAAVAAARQGLRVTLLEPGPQLGGVLVRGWLATLDDTQDRRRHSLYGGLYADFYRGVGGNRSIDIGVAERQLWRMLRQAHVDVRLNAALDPGAGAVQTRAGQVQAVWVRHGWDRRLYTARQFIDATDTAELAARAGAAFTVGREDGGLDRRQMAATLVLRIGGVYWPDVERQIRAEQLRYHDPAAFDGRGAYGFGPLSAGYRPADPGLRLRGLNIARQLGGTLLVNALLVTGVDGTSARSQAAGYARAAHEAPLVVAFLRRADAATFGRARLMGVAPELYIRESRHLVGLQRLHADDLLLGRAPPGTVATGGYALDGQIYDARESPFLLGQPAPYGVPFGTLVPRGLSNLLVVSQAASFDSAAAYSARVVPLQMALGQAAGTACAVAWQRRQSFPALARSVPGLVALRTGLTAQGARLPPETVASADGPLAGASRLQTFEAVRLLQRGLMGAPYPLRGQLGSGQPVLASDFLATLNHWLIARSTDPRQGRMLQLLQRWAAQHPNQTLSWVGGRAIFTALHEDTWEFDSKAGGLSRADAARLLTDMFPARDRQLPPTLVALAAARGEMDPQP